ncbi:hypothetical protein GGS20DRAFT_585875 [Poronia punctata]|nr:hypothetical protein GGS20DRAFT_585875 [Poronia punctata]
MGGGPGASSTAVPTTTDGLLLNYKPELASRNASLSVDCDSLESSIQVTEAKEKFLVYCGKNYRKGGRGGETWTAKT